jgi:hypothetical protein
MTTDQPADAGNSGVPDDPELLREDIERTREHLGDTVEALVAKADVKSQAKDKVGQLTDRLKDTTTQAKDQATTRVTQAKGQLTSKTQDVKQAATTNGAQGRDQIQARATAVGSKVRDVTPEPVQRAARHAAERTSPRQAAIAAAAVGVAVLGFILIRRRRRS